MLILNNAIQLLTINLIIVLWQCIRLLSKAGDIAANHATNVKPGDQAHQAANQVLRRISRRTWKPGTPCHEICHSGISISFIGFHRPLRHSFCY